MSLANLVGKRGTLTRQLVTRTAALVAVVAVAMSALITIVSTHILAELLDRQLDAAVALVQAGGQGNAQRPGAGPGIPPGTIIVVQTSVTAGADGKIPVYAWRTARGGWDTLSDESAQRLFDLSASPPGQQVRDNKASVVLPIGRYRVSVSERGGLKVVVGLPMEDLHRTTRTLLFAELVLGLVAVLTSIVVSGALVRRTVRPLSRLADAAREVSTAELDRGEVNLPVRVDTSTLHANNEVAEVGNAFNHMLNNVERALAARQASETKVRQFVADASHELRNPLAAIRGYAELTRMQGDELPTDIAHALTRIDAESARMSKLVSDLLLLARLDNDQPLAFDRVDLTEVVLNAVSDARAASPGHVWRLIVPEEPTEVVGDADRLHQVVSNLLSNARTHTPEGTVVTTCVEQDASRVVVRVIDDGPGIGPKLRGSVFERFARGDSSRRHSSAESTGLGLAIVSAVIAAHDGRVSLESEPGHTEFVVELPQHHDTSPETHDGRIWIPVPSLPSSPFTLR